jgi:hypothetical protein
LGKGHSLISITDPTAGDIPDNSEKANVIANILGSPHAKTDQDKMVTAVNDKHNETGHTKDPHVPVPHAHVHDVESKPDPIATDTNPETVKSPDSKAPVEEIIGDSASLAQKKSGSLSSYLLSQAN